MLYSDQKITQGQFSGACLSLLLDLGTGYIVFTL